MSDLTSGVLKFGKRVTVTGTVMPTSLAGSKITLTVQRQQASAWRAVSSLTRTISSSGTYSWIYKPAKRGTYRVQATITATSTHTAAATIWLTFAVQ